MNNILQIQAKSFDFSGVTAECLSTKARLAESEEKYSARGDDCDYLKGQLAMIQMEKQKVEQDAAAAINQLKRQLQYECAANDLLSEEKLALQSLVHEMKGKISLLESEVRTKVSELQIANDCIAHIHEEMEVIRGSLLETENLLEETQVLLLCELQNPFLNHQSHMILLLPAAARLPGRFSLRNSENHREASRE